ncbi:B-cell receptor CD22-like [Pygocentrus nattereri]|uniref:B-cell receptor CD22-like n=1 Tax=Pygocentrus nattereri TaxID=42514 RepID=UPI0018919C9B|nr:B-cell receptor CD22-like [Pygocentrus nattereri]
MEEDGHQNVDPNVKDDTYTALDTVSRSSDDVYNTPACGETHSGPVSGHLRTNPVVHRPPKSIKGPRWTSWCGPSVERPTVGLWPTVDQLVWTQCGETHSRPVSGYLWTSPVVHRSPKSIKGPQWTSWCGPSVERPTVGLCQVICRLALWCTAQPNPLRARCGPAGVDPVWRDPQWACVSENLHISVFCVAGVVAQDGWDVYYYKSTSICALKGSTVTMRCIYTYPRGLTVLKAFWTKQWGRGSEAPDLSDDPEYRGRVQYIGNKKHDCTLRLRDVRETDQSKYYFRFVTDQPGGKYHGAVGVDLSVTDLQVEVPERVIEGDKVTLTCKTTFSLTVRPKFTWYRNGHPLSSNTDQLHLQPVSREDAGRYRCAVLGLRSPEVTLNVKYLQVEVPERVIEGDKVTLTCKTSFRLSYRPTFTWYRNGRYSSSNTDQLHLQPVSREDASRYRCAVLGLRSPVVTLNVRLLSAYVRRGSMEKQKRQNGGAEKLRAKKLKSLTVDAAKCVKITDVFAAVATTFSRPSPTLTVWFKEHLSVSSGEIVEGRSVTLTCSSDANSPVQNYTWFKGTSRVGKGETYTMKEISSVDSGEYKCRSSNEHGEKLSEALTLNVLYPPKSVSVSISPTGVIVEGRSLTLTCSSDANPPVQNYTWFKEGGSSPVGSGHSYRAPQRGSYYCEAQNEHRSQKSAAVTIKGVWNSALYAVIGVTAGCGCLSVIIAVFCVRRKRRGSSADDKNQTQNVDPNAKENTYTPLDPVSRSSDDVYNTLATVRNKL